MSRDRLHVGYRHVTDIIDVFQKFAIPKKKLAELAERGTKVHDAITAHLTDQFYIIDEEIATFFEAYEKFKAENPFEIVAVQKRYFDNKLMITGEVDGLFKFGNDKYPTIVDFKTSRQENAAMWTLQGTFYYYLCKANGIEVEKKLRFVQLGGNYGMYFIRDYEFKDEVMEVCHAALTAHKYFNPEGKHE